MAVLDSEARVTDPDAALAPDHPPEAVHGVATELVFRVVQVKVAEP